MKKLIFFSLIMLLGIRAIGQSNSQEINQKNHIDMKETLETLKQLADKYDPYLQETRSLIHRYPGVRFSPKEDATLELIKSELARYINSDLVFNISLISALDGGLVLDVIFNPDYDWLIFRADVDALEITEKTGLDFSSKYPGLMHACGHDIHAAMLLTACRIMLTEPGLPIKHNIRFVFQRAEENPIDGLSGGKLLVHEGICKEMKAAYALHIWTKPELPAGTFMSCPGPMLGNSDRLKITITAPGGHVANPDDGSSAIDVSFTVYQEMRKIYAGLSKDSVSLSPAIINSGKQSNVRPQEAELWFACRNYLPTGEREAFHQMIRERLEKEVGLHHPDAKIVVESIYGHPTLSNDSASYQNVVEILSAAGETTAVAKKILGGEDFAHYLNQIPGCMFMLGAYQPGSGDVHTSTFNPDPAVFKKGVLFWLLLATN